MLFFVFLQYIYLQKLTTIKLYGVQLFGVENLQLKEIENGQILKDINLKMKSFSFNEEMQKVEENNKSILDRENKVTELVVELDPKELSKDKTYNLEIVESSKNTLKLENLIFNETELIYNKK